MFSLFLSPRVSYGREDVPSIFHEQRCFGQDVPIVKPGPMPTIPSWDDGPIGPPPPPPPECKPATAPATVNPGNFAAAKASLGGGKTIVLAPGSYPSLGLLSGKDYGGSTIQCAQAGQCRFPNSTIHNVSGLTIDGIYVGGGNIGLYLKGTHDMTIRCSVMKEMEGTGILVVGDGGNLKLHNNTLYNSKLGCNTLNKSECGYRADGSVLPYMDYGIRIHNANTVEILGNRFTGDGGKGLFNHSISLKEKVAKTFIVGNTFDACGRNCIEPGQQESNTHDGDISSGTVTITGNTFNNTLRTTTILLVKNIHKVIFQDNTFNSAGGRRIHMYFFEKGTRGYPPLTNAAFIKGVPRDRTVVGNGE